MSYNIGFYFSGEYGDGKDVEKQSNKQDNFRQLFCAITERTGWSPEQIRELTLPQIIEYLKGWSKPDNSNSELEYQDIQLFNITSGIPIKYIKKKK